MIGQKDIVNIVIASPNDLQEVRDRIPTLFTMWNNMNSTVHIEPKMYETCCVPEMGDHPQQIINKQMLEDGHLLIAMFWSKVGTKTPNAESGTIEEIQEFIKKKGGSRVMIYFSKKPLPPDEMNSEELGRLENFKAEMQSKGLYDDFKDTNELERKLLQHLTVRIEQLLKGELPEPGKATAGLTEDTWYSTDNPDSRLQKPMDFGNSLPEIADGFSKKMNDFDQQDGAGVNKFLGLGVHVYMSVSQSIEQVVVRDAYALSPSLKSKLNTISLCLKKLSESKSIEEFSEFWNEGRKISDDLNKLIQKIDRD